MATIPKRVLERLARQIPVYQEVLAGAKDHDVNESDTVTIVTDILADGFGGSTQQDDYRWGLLHRVTFRHPLDQPVFNVPTAGGAIPQPLPNLSGIPMDGASSTVDPGGYSLRAASAHDFTFDHGASLRFVAEVGPGRVRGRSSLPGGASGNPFSPLYTNLLLPWLTNDAGPMLFTSSEMIQNLDSVILFVPAP